MTLIATGRGLRRSAMRGFGANAQLEGREIAAAENLDAAREAQRANTMGTSAGIGASYGLNKTIQAGKAASDSLNTLNSISGVSDAGTFINKGGKLALDTGAGVVEGQQAINVAANSANQAAQAKALAAGAEGGSAAVAATGAEAVAATEAAAATAGTAAGSTGTMATLSSLAAPIAIGLGAAFLINKLFD